MPEDQLCCEFRRNITSLPSQLDHVALKDGFLRDFRTTTTYQQFAYHRPDFIEPFPWRPDLRALRSTHVCVVIRAVVNAPDLARLVRPQDPICICKV